MSEMKRTSTGDNRRSFDYIPEFPSIPGPLVRLEDIQDLGIYSCHQSSILLVQALNHYMRQQRDVFRACAKGRKEDLKHAQSVEDVIPQVGSAGWLVAANNRHINGHLVTATEAAHAQRFKNAQQNRVARIEASRQAHPERGFRREPARNSPHDAPSPR